MIAKWRQEAKAVRRMHQRSSCANGRMQRRNSRTTKAMVKAVRKVHRWYSRTDERMWRRNSCTDERMRRRNSCTDDRGTKVVAKAVRKVHRGYSRTDERMRRRSSCTDDRGTKAVATEVRKMHLWLWNKGSDEGRNKALDSMSTQEGWSMMQPPRLRCQQLRGGDDGYANKATHLWSRNDGGKCGQSSGLSAASRRMINDEAANARIRWTPRQEGQDAATRLKLMLGSHRANFYVLHRINQVDHKKKKKKGENACYGWRKKRTKRKKENS